MALQLKRTSPVKARLLSTFLMMFALMLQPMYGLVAGEIASAATPDLYVDQANGADANDCTAFGTEACLTIQGALDKASTGDVISVAAGTYAENLEITKQVRLEGNGAARTTIVNDPAKSTYLIRLNNSAQSGTKISGFTLQNNAFDQPVLKLATDAHLSNLYITGNHFKSTNKHLIYAGNVSDSNFTSNTFYVDGINNDTVKRAAVIFDGISNGNTFKNNKFVGSMESMTLGIDGDNNTFLTNNLSGLTTTYHKVFEVKGNNNTDTGNVYGDNQVVINPGTSSFRGVYSTIADAVDVAHSGDTLAVMAGSYTMPQTVISKDLTIVGAGAGSVVITPTQNTGTNDSINTSAWILVEDGNEFNLSGVTINGEGYKIKRALTTYGTGVIEDSVFKNIKYTTNIGMGVTVFGDVTVQGNTFENIERIGVHVRKAYAGTAVGTAVIQANTFVGEGIGEHVQYGIEIGAASYALVKDNTFSNFRGVAYDDSESAGILATDFYGAGTEVDIEGNTFTDNTYGVAVGYGDTDETVVNMHHNNIEGNHKAGVTARGDTTVDASENWWGDWSGPSDVASGSGDSVAAGVVYSPWLCQPYSAGQVNPRTSDDDDANCESVSGTVEYANNQDGTGTLEFTVKDTDGNPITDLEAGDFTVKSDSGSNFAFTHERFTVTNNDGGSYTVLYAPYVDVDSKWDIKINNLPFTQNLHMVVTDTKAPEITGLHIEQNGSPAGDYTNQRYITVQWDGATAGDFAYFEYENKSGWRNLGSTSEFSGDIGGSSGPDGLYTYSVRAVDAKGNKGPVSTVSITLDTTAPDVKILGANLTSENTITFTGEVSDSNFSHYYCWLTPVSGGEVGARGENCLTTWASDLQRNGNPATSLVTGTDGEELLGQIDITGLADGEYIIRMGAKDRAGNLDTTATYAFVVDRSVFAPVVPEPPLEDEETTIVTNNNTGESLPEDDDDDLITPFTAPVFGFAFQPFTNDTNDGDDEVVTEDNDDSGVAGVQDQEEGTPLEDTGEVLGLMDKNFFGLAWYWWLAIVAALVGGWLAIAAMIRHSREEEV